MKKAIVMAIIIGIALSVSYSLFIISKVGNTIEYGIESERSNCSCIAHWNNESKVWESYWYDCNNDLGKPNNDGCEIDLANDVNNCGSCNFNCNNFIINNAEVKCYNKTCYFKCKEGFASPYQGCTEFNEWISYDEIKGLLQDFSALDCSINLNSDDEHCGSCNTNCTALGKNYRCINGKCILYECQKDEDCYDGNPCTYDACQALEGGGSKCVHTILNGKIKNGKVGNYDISKEVNYFNLEINEELNCIKHCTNGVEYTPLTSKCEARCENGNLENCPSHCSYDIKKCRYECEGDKCKPGYYCEAAFGTCRVCTGRCGDMPWQVAEWKGGCISKEDYENGKILAKSGTCKCIMGIIPVTFKGIAYVVTKESLCNNLADIEGDCDAKGKDWNGLKKVNGQCIVANCYESYACAYIVYPGGGGAIKE